MPELTYCQSNLILKSMGDGKYHLSSDTFALRFVMMIKWQDSWMKLILEYIQNGISLEDQKERRKLQRRVAKFYIIDNNLYRRGFTQPLLKCLKRP